MNQVDINSLIASRSQIIANLASETLKPKPSYSIDGRSVDWVSWQQAQLDQIERLTKLINALQPFIIGTRMCL